MVAVVCEALRGLIPAHAGKTLEGRDRRHHQPAHPRSRGENARARRLARRLQGSSPLTRGKLCARERDAHGGGLIPAHAGKTWRAMDSPATGCGSSPLTRGKHALFFSDDAVSGLIPAHAGKTPRLDAVLGQVEAHPRSRGENSRPCWMHCLRRGSSPLTRGKLDVGVGVDQVGGLIPAHAGKTFCRAGGRFARPAHPRSRGENFTPSGAVNLMVGSSPLTRGKRGLPDQPAQP